MKRHKSLKAISDKRRAYLDELQEVLPALWARSGGVCEVCRSAPAVHPHHRLRRSQGGKNDLDNLLAVCAEDHRLIHDHPEYSYAQGWLVRRKGLASVLAVD